jgi:UDP-2,3-diacylglucosamine pyrophosphatase LpxH
MRTAIVSDLHLGSAFGEDVARDPDIRRPLLEEIRSADRLVLLGDVLELRERPLAPTLATARPFFEEVGAAMAGRQVILVPGNHDHRLAELLLEELALARRPIELEHHSPARSDAARMIAGWLGDAALDLAYPGIWLREDVYATHGHYMDCHMTLPRLECIAAAVMMRLFGRVPSPATPFDYERVLRPVYGLSYSLAQSDLAQRATRPSERAWRAISRRDGNRGRARRAARGAAVAAAVPASVWGVNRLLRSEFDPVLTGEAIAASGVVAATELAERLRVGDGHLITGHTHRGGPGEEDGTWPLRGGGSLHNTGSWVFASAFHHPGTPPGPYWPGTVTWVEDDGAPRRARLLGDRPREELAEVVRSQRSRRET